MNAAPSLPAPGAPAGAPADVPADVPAEDAPSAAAEYAALRDGALLVDHSARDLWLFGGEQARATLTGLVTNDVGGLEPGHGCYAAALTAKGRIVADVRVFAVGEGVAGAATGGSRPRLADPAAAPDAWLDGVALLVDVPARAAAGWEALVRKFVNPRVAPYRRAGNAVRAFGVYGARAREAVAHGLGAGCHGGAAALSALPQYGHVRCALGGTPLVCARVPDLGGPDGGRDGFMVFVPAPAFDAAWTRVAAAVPGVLAGSEGAGAYAAARIEAGYPEWGRDIDDATIPQEANFDALGAISYTKGCYTGQEVVARIHFRGHVNRYLRGLAFGLAEGEDGVPAGAELVDEQGKAVGLVRSTAWSPRRGGVGLAMVRREVPDGAVLTARWGDGERAVSVEALPFPA